MTEKESEGLFVPRPVPCSTSSHILTLRLSGRGETAHCFLLSGWPRRSTIRWASQMTSASAIRSWFPLRSRTCSIFS